MKMERKLILNEKDIEILIKAIDIISCSSYSNRKKGIKDDNDSLGSFFNHFEGIRK